MFAMQYRNLGRSGLKVSTLTMGTMTFGGQGWAAAVGAQKASEARRLIDICLDAGVNLLDTSNAYSAGMSEEIIGEVLNGERPHDVLICTKVRFPMGDGPNSQGLSRKHIIEACKASLRRMRTEHIDVYLLHEIDSHTPMEETMEAMDTLVRHGHVRYIGCSNFSAWQVMKGLGISDRERLARFVTQQIHYTPEAREAEYELLPLSLDQGIGVMVWSPLAAGLLSGKHRKGRTAEGSRQLAGWTEPPIRDEDRLWRIVDALVAIGEARGISAAQVTLAWALTRPAVATLVIGGRTEEQFRDNLAAADLELTAEELATLDEVSRPPVIYPYWHQWQTARERLGAPDMVLRRD
jgi:aryl-alcohol dehydrogenase-like predicted oxidoreductase